MASFTLTENAKTLIFEASPTGIHVDNALTAFKSALSTTKKH